MVAPERIPTPRLLTSVAGGAFLALALALPGPASARGGICSSTSQVGLVACLADTNDNYFTTVGNCKNLTDAEERSACNDDAKGERSDARKECGDVYGERQAVCDAIGQAAYDPQIDPNDFETSFTNQNPYWPLAVGNQWVFEGNGETDTVTVLDETKLIQDVHCIVVHDVVEADGTATEDTDDWYGVHKNGDVRYFGEISKSLETFAGDAPEVPELVDIDGSWKADRDDAKSGIVMFQTPEVGTIYRQEWAFGEAEDMAEVLSVDYDYSDGGDLDQLVPQALAELMCDHDCVVTSEWSTLEPGVRERKYYARGIGVFLETNTDTGEFSQLVACNLADARCSAL